jgi:hypothetical protein
VSLCLRQIFDSWKQGFAFELAKGQRLIAFGGLAKLCPDDTEHVMAKP